jgi:hypothetical protein
MATAIRQIAQIENGLCYAYIDYDDTSFNVLTVRVVNDSDFPIRFIVTRADGHQVGQIFAAHQTFSIAIPKNGANAINFNNLGAGKWGNVSWQVDYPA